MRGFESEAQLVAQLEHPHLVPLYDYWREPGARIPRDALAARRDAAAGAARGPWNLEPATRLLAQIAGALAYAHRQGVVHRDVKPANVLLDEEGNAYLSDFGIAARLPGSENQAVWSRRRRRTWRPNRSPDSRSHRGRTSTASDDDFELLTGQRPPMDAALPALASVRPDLPAALDEVVAGATAADPHKRYESAEGFRRAFVLPLGQAARAAETYTPAENPYKGLRPFGEADAVDFQGRVALVDRLVHAVATDAWSPWSARPGSASPRSSRLGSSPRSAAGRWPDRNRGSWPHVARARPLPGARRRAPPGGGRETRRPGRELARTGRAAAL